MTLKELKKEISESPSKDFFSSMEIQISVSNTGIHRKLNGLSSFYNYLENQITGFKSFEGDIPDDIKNSIKVLEGFKSNVLTFWDSYNKSINLSQIKTVWESQLGRLLRNNHTFFEFDAPITIFLLEVFQNKRKNYGGAFAYLTSGISPGAIQDRDYLNGLILAYEYFQKGETEIKKRREIEKSSLSRFRNHIDDYISQADKDFIDYSAGLKEKADKTIEEISVYKSAKSEEYEKWFSNTSTDFSSFDEVSKKKILDLEELYREKLKLEAPAQYWNLRATGLRREGYFWLGGLILSILGGVWIFVYALQLLADGTLVDIFDDTATAIKWSVIFITLVSFLAFLIKTLSKMTFSTFHLVRDSEEREQLTYVFLAMQKEKAIDPTERHLIMQSLFSRADTGLLKDDGSPTMPGNIFDKMVANGK